MIKNNNKIKISKKESEKNIQINHQKYKLNPKILNDFEIPQRTPLTLYVNVDDEANILKMNKRLMSKLDVELTCLRDRSELLGFLCACKRNPEYAQADLRVVVLMDHMLDRDYGWAVIGAAREATREWGWDVLYFSVSSSDDKDTRALYTGLVQDFITKPLNRSKAADLVRFVDEKAQVRVEE
eukprot:Mrub_05282.p2 GENE.Mrub_05282~~Mrub_05282.p2  ORF type:complete len:200 (-),score=69.18 Mrub_05282:552-1100(-)